MPRHLRARRDQHRDRASPRRTWTRSRIVVFTGQVPTLLIGNDAFQEADIVGITRPCTKHNYLVKEAKDLARIIKEAFYIARTGRPGPVLVDMPKDVLVAIGGVRASRKR